MSDERVIDYLRQRGRVTPPHDLVAIVMAGIDNPPVAPSRFSAYVPAFVAVGAAAVVAVLALVLGQARDIGPAPTPSATPSASAEALTVVDLRVALMASVDVLRAATGVEGLQLAEIDGTIGTATWFDWRPNGDQVVVTRSDLDVTETGWWMVPDGAPPATGQRIYTNIQAKVGDEFFFVAEGGDWQVAARDDAILAIGSGILDRSILPWYPLMGLDFSFPDPLESEAEARIERDDLPDGGVEWSLDYEWLGEPAVQRWTIGPGGELRSWTLEREGRSFDAEGSFNGNVTRAWLQFTIIDGDPIEPPDIDAVPDADAVGVPADLPLQPLGTPSPTATLDELEVAVTAAVDALARSEGVQGTHIYTIEHYLASATWFDWRPNGDQVVVERHDIDVSAPWWTDPDGEPLSVGERIDTNISVMAEDSQFFARDEGWIVALKEDRPPLTYAIGLLAGEIPVAAGVPPNADVTVTRDALQDGGEVWVLEFGRDGGPATVEWRMDAEGRLVSHSVQGAGVAMTPGVDLGSASTRAVFEFMPLADPEPISAPDLGALPDPAALGLPNDFPLQATPSSAPEP